MFGCRENPENPTKQAWENDFFKKKIKKPLESWFFHLMQTLEKEQTDTQLRQTYPSASVHLIISFLSLSFSWHKQYNAHKYDVYISHKFSRQTNIE